MKKAMLLAAFIVACGPSEQPAGDTAAMAGPALAAADVSGTWSGTTMAEGSDSVISRWTVVNPTGMEGKLIVEGSTDSVSFTNTFDADSFVAVTTAYADPTMPGQQVTTRAVGRLVAGKLVGTANTMLASNPDSVVQRSRWEASRQ